MSYTCSICGKELDTATGLANHEVRGHGKPWQDKNEFARLWIEKGLTHSEMADKWGCAKSTVNRWGDRHDLEKPWRVKETLERLYEDEGFTQGEIADRFGVHLNTIQNQFKNHDIDTEWKGADDYPVYHGFKKRWSDIVGSEYEVVTTTACGETVTVMVHQLIAYAHGKMDFEEFVNPDVITHHKSGHGLDNRPENIGVMGRSEHMAHHHEIRSN